MPPPVPEKTVPFSEVLSSTLPLSCTPLNETAVTEEPSGVPFRLSPFRLSPFRLSPFRLSPLRLSPLPKTSSDERPLEREDCPLPQASRADEIKQRARNRGAMQTSGCLNG